MVKYCSILILLCSFYRAYAQSDSLSSLDDVTRDVYHDAFTHDEDDDRFLQSAELYSEYIEHFLRYPLLILAPSRIALEEIPFATDIDINRFLEFYRGDTRHHPLVIGKSPLKKYLLTRTSSHTNHIELRSRLTLDPDANDNDEYITGLYEGSPMKYYNRLLVSADMINFGMLQTKTAGEPLFFDQLAMYLQLSRPFQFAEDIRLRKFILGDYSLSFGEGLALSLGMLQLKSRDAILPTSNQRTSLREYLSSSSYRYFRGASATIDAGRFTITPFYSERPLDATLTDTGTVSSIHTTGYHRTASELARRNSIRQECAGAYAGYNILQEDAKYFNLSTLAYHLSYSKPVIKSDSLMTKFYGSELLMYSFASVYATTLYSVRGEFARSHSDAGSASAFVLSGLIYPWTGTEATLQLRLLPENFISPLGSVFGDNADDAQNETGLYLGLRQQITNFTLQGYIDVSKRDAHEYDATYTPRTYDYRFTAGYTSNSEQLSFELDSRIRRREDIQRDTNNSTELYTYTKFSERLLTRFTISEKLLLVPRASYLRYMKNETHEDGIAIGFQARYTPFEFLSTQFGLDYYSTDSFNSRIYLNESDLPGAVSLTSVYGNGVRYFLLIRSAPTDELSLGLKVSGSSYHFQSKYESKTILSAQIDIQL